MAERKRSGIASKTEVLQTFTSIMRGEMTEGGAGVPPKISERCKAAELLGKQYGLFDRKEELQPKADVIHEIREALERLHDGHASGSP